MPHGIVHIDGEGLGPVHAVVVLAVGGGVPLDPIIRNVTPTPEEGGKTDIVPGSCRPDRLHPILNNQYYYITVLHSITISLYYIVLLYHCIT